MTDWKAQARRLLASGMNIAQVAKIMGRITVEIEALKLESQNATK